MSLRHIYALVLAAALVLVGCATPATPVSLPVPTEGPQHTRSAPTSEPAPTPTEAVAREGILFSEVLPGNHGVDNNFEFIEIYNIGTEAVDLKGWSIWYRLVDNKQETLLHAWEDRADIPG